VRVLKVNAIIATIATLGIIQGIAILLRPAPEGTISAGLTSALSYQLGSVPVAFIGSSPRRSRPSSGVRGPLPA